MGGHDFEVDAGGFWQVHPGAAPALVGAMLVWTAAAAWGVVLDLYAGAGLFAVLLGEAVAGAGRVVAVEGSQQAAADARSNLRRSAGSGPRCGTTRCRPRPLRACKPPAWTRTWSCSTRLGPAPAPT